MTPQPCSSSEKPSLSASRFFPSVSVGFWLLRRALRCAACFGLVLVMGCANSGPPTAFHGFSFDGRYDGWSESIDLLSYSYGDQYHMVRSDLEDPNYVFRDENWPSLPPVHSVSGEMPIGEFLAVKWRVHATGKVFNERVDLRPLFPKDITNHKLTFVIDGAQLHVYLATPIAQPDEFKANHKTWRSAYQLTYPIFPERIFPTPD